MQTLNVLIKVRVPRKTGKFLTRWAILASQEICPTYFARTLWDVFSDHTTDTRQRLFDSRSEQISKKSRNRVKILGSRRVAWIKFYTEDTHFKGDLRTWPLSGAFSTMQVTYTLLQVTTWVITLKRHIPVALLNATKVTSIIQSINRTYISIWTRLHV
jgi:hypothetical protein